MPDKSKPSVFGTDKLKVQLPAEEFKELEKKVEDGPFEAEARLDGQDDLRLFGQAIAISGGVDVKANIRGIGSESAFFCDEKTAPPPGHAFAELEVEGEVAVEGGGTAPIGSGISLSFSGQLQAALSYRHTLAVPASQVRRVALEQAISLSRLPRQIDLRRLADREVHHLQMKLAIDAGAKLMAGWEQAVKKHLFIDVSEKLEAEFRAALQASVGKSFFDEMTLTVGRVCVHQPDWVRLRLSRTKRDGWSLGTLFALQVEYDLGSSFVGLLDVVLQRSGFGRIQKALKHLVETADQIAEGDWEAVREIIEDETAELIGKLLRLDGIVDSIAKADAVREFVDRTRSVVDTYDNLDKRLQNLWDRVLGSTEIGPGSPLRRALEDIALLPSDPGAVLERIVGDQFRDAVELLEALADRTLEELVTAEDNEVMEVVRNASALAQSALHFLNGLPVELTEAIRAFSRDFGIESIIDWLRANATDLDSLKRSLKDAAHSEIRKVVEFVLDKALDDIGPDDLKHLQRWSEKVGEALGNIATVDQRLKDVLENLKGEVGFSMGLEWERVTRTGQFLDIELDPDNDSCRGAYQELACGDVAGFLDELPALGDGGKEQRDLPCRIHDAGLFSRRTRTSAFSFFFSLFGRSREGTRRTEEAAVVLSEPEAGNVVREGHYAGALTCFRAERGIRWQSSLWLTADASGRGAAISRVYDQIRCGLRLTSTRSEENTPRGVMVGIQELLTDLGFEEAFPHLFEQVPSGTATKLAITVEAAEGFVEALLSELEGATSDSIRSDIGWDVDYLNAGYRWFYEPLMDSLFPDVLRSGSVEVPGRILLAELLRTRFYWEKWKIGAPAFRAQYKNATADYKGTHFSLPERPRSYVEFLISHQSRRLLGPKNYVDVFTAREKATAGKRPDDLMELMEGFSHAAAASTPTVWGNVMFPVWLAMARVTRINRHALREARGIATFRWKDENELWKPPLLFRLESGLKRHPLGASKVFPVPKGNTAPVPKDD